MNIDFIDGYSTVYIIYIYGHMCSISTVNHKTSSHRLIINVFDAYR